MNSAQYDIIDRFLKGESTVELAERKGFRLSDVEAVIREALRKQHEELEGKLP